MENLREKHKIRSWLEKYSAITDTLIETGSHEGNGIEAAFAYGFKQVISVEIQGQYYVYCQGKFANDITLGRLVLLLGDSVEHIPMMLQISGNKRCTFWLDAHIGGPVACPILEEIAAIGSHSRKDHIILIDDYYDFGTPAHDNITIYQVKKAILEINPNYQFSREDTGTPGAVLVAKID